MQRENNFLEFRSLSFSFNQRTLIKESDFSLGDSQFSLLLGHNGSGKTTFLKILAGHIKNWKGSLIIRGKTYTSQNWNPLIAFKEGIALIGQFPQFPKNLFVWEYLLWNAHLKIFFWLSSQRAILYLKKVLSPFSCYFNFDFSLCISDLSQSERFLLSVASAILRAKKLILWDESLVYLNLKEKLQVYSLILILKERGVSSLLVTHENLDWLRQSDKIFFIKENILNLIKLKTLETIFGNQVDPILPQKQNFLKSFESLIEVRDSQQKTLISIRNHEFIVFFSSSESLLRTLEAPFLKNQYNLSVNFYWKGSPLKDSYNKFRKKMAYLSSGLGANQEEALYSFVLPFLFQSKSSLNHWSGVLSFKKMISFCQQHLNRLYWNSLMTSWEKLSGGEKQFFILRRELAKNPKFLLGFLPARGLDQKSIRIFYKKVHNYVKENLSCALIFTMDREEARYLSDRVYEILENGHLKDIS